MKATFLRAVSAFLLVLLCGFTTTLSANSYPEGDGSDSVKFTGKTFRCFSQIGHAYSTLQNDSRWIGLATYCLPEPPTGCYKDWDWSLSNKNDSASETAASKNCKFTKCRPNGGCNTNCHVFSSAGAGRWTPVRTYSYCVLESDTQTGQPGAWENVSKCVDKTTGKDISDRKLCDNDTNGVRYYYKPKCNETDTKESCTNKLKALAVGNSYGWRFCYQPSEGGSSNIKSFLQNQGGQTVRFREFIAWDITGWNRTGPCEKTSLPPSGGDVPDPDKKPEVLGNLIIIDWDDSKQPASLIHTKVSGNAYDFKIYETTGTIDSGIEKVSCQISYSDGTIMQPMSAAGSKFSWNSLFAFKFSAPKSTFAKSGKYNIRCEGTSKQGNSISAEKDFFVAPHSYQFNIVNAEFNNTTSLASKGGIVNENLINDSKTSKAIKYNETLALTHNNNSWTKKPTVKIDELLNVNLAEVIAYNADGGVDVGVDAANNLSGVISSESKSNLKGITNANNMPPTTSASNCANSVAQSITAKQVEMTTGVANSSGVILTISADNALVGTMEAEIFDLRLRDTILDEQAKGLCQDTKGAKFPCPYPARLKLNFDYEVVPASFKAELLDSNNDPLKVLYFGMGSSPAVEATTKLRITALKNANAGANDTANTFSKNCAAENMKINTQLQGAGFSIKILDKDGNDLIIEADKFNNGIANIDAIVKVDKDENVDFTPNMKSEPIFTGDKYPNGLPAKMEFANFPPANTYYPNYDDIKVNPNTNMVILRARINAIDTDNSNLNSKIPDDTKVWYEFQCEYCNIDKVAAITGANNGKGYTNADRSPTQQGWWIDRTFSKYNQNKITKSEMLKIESTNNNSNIKGIDSVVSDGLQKIQYNSLSLGTHKLNIRHYINGDKNSDSMPNFLLYNTYWNTNVRWNTSAFIYIKGSANDEKRDYGIDTGGAKNTRSGGRTGKF